VVAIHLGHHNPPTPELAQRLGAWGAEVHPDGTTLRTGSRPQRPPRPGRILVLGGARSGKSSYAEGLLADRDRVTYVAPAGAQPDDEEWLARVRLHRDRRPASWVTRETTDIAAVLRTAGPDDAVLVDCLTLWLTSVIDEVDGWEEPDKADAAVAAATADLVGAWRSTRALVVAVSNEVGQGVVPATVSGRLFRDALGRLNLTVAAASEEVVLLVAGRPHLLRGGTTP
jgi:adenosylcobinamide kinase/adenosylcobinamide-phosphate guanylyltransferase